MTVKGDFQPLVPRFEEKFIPEPNSGCWIWIAGLAACSDKHKLSYGRFHFSGKPIGAHVMSWRIYNGEIPSGLCVLHSCDNAMCVNPRHLFLGTHKDNTHDMMAKGRHAPMLAAHLGERSHFAKLTAAQVLEIRSLPGTQSEIAKQFGVSQTAIGLIKRRVNWGHL